MNMIYRNDTLYIDEIEDEDLENISNMKKKLFSVLEQYEVDSVVININSNSNYKKSQMNSIINDYHENYKGNLIVDIK